VELALGMPARLAVTSLLNALAHPVSALSTGRLDDDGQRTALKAAGAVQRALLQVLQQPEQRSSRRAAFEATVLAGRVLARFAVGLHHRLAHLLGGHFDLDHAGLHSVLLPHTLDELRGRIPQLHAALCEELAVADPAAGFLQALSRAGASTSLQQLGVAREPFEQLLGAHADLPRALLEAAYSGRR
jgi:alcohol dehydrogenase class IV